MDECAGEDLPAAAGLGGWHDLALIDFVGRIAQLLQGVEDILGLADVFLHLVLVLAAGGDTVFRARLLDEFYDVGRIHLDVVVAAPLHPLLDAVGLLPARADSGL